MMAERMDAAVAQFQSLERAVAGHVVHMQRTGDTMTAAGTTFGVASERLRQAAEPLTSTLIAIEASAREATESLRLATAAKGALESAASSLMGTAEQANKAFQSYQDRFASTDDVLGRTFEKLVGGVTDLSVDVAKVVAEMQSHLANAVGSLGGGVEQVREMVEGMTATVSDLSAVLSRAPEKIL
jgi:phage-related tail protein